jgi:hypothetical protein
MDNLSNPNLNSSKSMVPLICSEKKAKKIKQECC